MKAPRIFGSVLLSHALGQYSERSFYESVLDCRLPEPEIQAEWNSQVDLETIHVVYTSDARHFSGLLTSMISLANHLAEPWNCVIHQIVDSRDRAQAEELNNCFRREMATPTRTPMIAVHEMKPFALNLTDLLYWRTEPRMTAPHDFLKYYLHEYLPREARVLLIEPDTIVLSDIAPLFRMRMKHALAAVPTRERTFSYYYRYMRGHYHRHLRRHVLDADRYLFNGGLLLYNLKLWRSGSITRSLEALTRLFSAHELTQLALNVQFQNAFDAIPWTWNVVGAGWPGVVMPPICVERARILHFSGDCKPWSGTTHGPRKEQCQNKDLYLPHAPRHQCGASSASGHAVSTDVSGLGECVAHVDDHIYSRHFYYIDREVSNCMRNIRRGYSTSLLKSEEKRVQMITSGYVPKMAWPDGDSNVDARRLDLEKWALNVSLDLKWSSPFFDLRRGAVFNASGEIMPAHKFCSKVTFTRAVHYHQTPAIVDQLKSRWSSFYVFGSEEVRVVDLVYLLHFVVDHTDPTFYYSSQLVHTMQMYELIQRTEQADQAVRDLLYYEHMKVAALVHDLGKLLSIHGELEQNNGGSNRILCEAPPGAGLHSPLLVQNFGHDEFTYMKLGRYLPSRVALAVRFHTLMDILYETPKGTQMLQEVCQGDEYETILPFVKAFSRLDEGSKRRSDGSDFIPWIDWGAVEGLLAKYFPNGRVRW